MYGQHSDGDDGDVGEKRSPAVATAVWTAERKAGGKDGEGFVAAIVPLCGE